MKKITAIALFSLVFSLNLYASPIDVSQLATAGSGTAVSPWTGWDTAITWVGEQEYYFPCCVYAFQTSPNFLKTGIALRGEAGTVLKHTGSGNAITFDNPGGASPIQANWTENVRMENFIIQGNAATTNGLLLRGVRNGIFKHISVRDVSGAGLRSEACVTNLLENFRVSHWENNPGGTWNVRPAYGIDLSIRAQDGASSTTWTILNPVIEGVGVIGIKTDKDCVSNVVIGGTVEGNLDKGIVLGSILNTLIGTFLEANTGNNIEVNSARNVLIGMAAYGTPTIIGSTGYMNEIIGGEYQSISMAGVNNVIQATLIRGAGAFIDTGDNNMKFALGIGGVAVRDSFLGNILPKPVGLGAVGGIVSTDANRNSAYMITANGLFVLDNPTNPSNGQLITWRIKQNTGSASISFGSKFRPRPGQPFPTLTTIVGEYDYISAKYNSARDTWDIQ